MKNLIRIGVFAFGIFIFQATSALASDYNYLPPDVLIKQNETISSLQYQLQSLQNNSANSSSAIDSRIAELQQQRNTEKSYISGVYGQSGIGDQLQSKLSEIDEKYQSQIDALQQQKSSSPQQNNNEENNLGQRIIELQKQSIQQQDEYQKLLDAQLEAMKNAPQQIYQIETAPTPDDVYAVFAYMDSLPLKDASVAYQKLKVINPILAEQVNTMYQTVYPHGKVGTATNDDYKASLKPTQNPTKDVATTPVQTIQPTTTTTTSPIVPIENIKPEPIRQTFTDKFFGFFKRLIFWK